MAALGLCAAVAVWILGATVAAGYLGLNALAARREIEHQKLAYLALLSDIGEYHQEFSRIVGHLEGNQSLLLSRLETARAGDPAPSIDAIRNQLKDTKIDEARMLVVRQALRSHLERFETDLKQLAARDANRKARLESTMQTLEQTRSEGAELAAARSLLDEQLRQVETDLKRSEGEKSELQVALAASQDELQRSQRENGALQRESRAFHAEVENLYSEVAAAPAREEKLQTQIASLESNLDAVNRRADLLKSQRDFQQTRADKMESRLDEVSDIQSAVVARLAQRTTAGIDMIERIVSMTGLDVNKLLGETNVADLGLSQGGPYIDVGSDAVKSGDSNLEFQSSVASLNQQMDRWEALQEVIRTIPLVSPLDQYQVTSGFGERVDPVNHRKAMHYGVDLKAPLRTPVMATAPGTVVFAGWLGEYGRVVEIDHGNGIHTRYAHLRKILVKQGQEVTHRQEIGLLGTSGRSTGPHVHYEILVDGKPRDPSLFVMAGRNAFKE